MARAGGSHKTSAKRSDILGYAVIAATTAVVVFLIFTAIYPVMPGARPTNAGRVAAQSLFSQYDGRYQVVDARSTAAYNAGHLPGALSVPVASLRDPDYHTTLSPGVVAAHLDAVGLDPERPVLVYADALADAAYVGWVLVSLGHPHVRLLDGGYKAWVSGGGAIETGAGLQAGASGEDAGVGAGAGAGAGTGAGFGTGGGRSSGTWTARAAQRWPSEHYLDLIDLYERIDDPNITLIDARAAGPERSAVIKALGSGNSRQVAWNALTTADGTAFQNPMAIHRALQGLPARKQLVVYGDETTTSALVWWSLYEYGYTNVARFDEPFAAWDELGFPTEAVQQGGSAAPSARLGGGCG